MSIDTSQALQPKTSRGLHVIFIGPSQSAQDQRGGPGNEFENVHTAVSLVAVLCGRSAVFEHVCDQDISPNSPVHVGFSGPREVPWALEKPDLSPEQLKIVNNADQTLANLQASERKRVILSLRWLRMGFGDVGVDAVLKYWIAIETLAINVKGINQILSASYNISMQEAGERFLVGRLHGFRGNIVHQGEIPRNPSVVIGYMEALYSDILCAFLQLPCPQKAGEYISQRRSGVFQFMASNKAE